LTRGAATLSLLMALAGCSPQSDGGGAMPALPPASTVVHPNGLRLGLPAGYHARVLERGYVVQPDPSLDKRSPILVSVLLTDQALPMKSPRSREVAGQRFDFEIVREEVDGSGGAEHTLSACRRAGARWLCLQQMHQREIGEPSFELWTLAAAASAP
jgi:hypothetical protein